MRVTAALSKMLKVITARVDTKGKPFPAVLACYYCYCCCRFRHGGIVFGCLLIM